MKSKYTKLVRSIMHTIFLGLKDLLIIAVCIVLVYYTLNNNYVRPTLYTVPGVWSINKREHKLLLGVSGHTYLELTDNNGIVRGQIHGFAYDESTGEIVERATRSGYKLKAFAFDYNYYHKEKDIDHPGTILYSGNATDTLTMWYRTKLCAAAIDAQNIDYPRYGFKIINETENSNSVAHSIIKCAGMEDVSLGLITPGRNTELIKTSP